ncbi:PilN domain-containing protein [Photobacterium aphoticum]|uniref:PilN domain-containing protein n=2 Tax=Photobacterium aphoticum TaxID=754436 RepID=UPI000AE9C500|nr:PilN domain-containing protein [Photobacterium aphoticum]GHA54634.1 MSHA biogenesis protein MshI [Photobacterium aphoticum]
MLSIKTLKQKKQSFVAGVALFADRLALVYRVDTAWLADEEPVQQVAEWPAALRRLLERHPLKGCGLRLVLGHGLYQSMLIDKPELPREEYPTALPFLVRELVNESPQELVADGFPSPLKDRLQVFCTQRRPLEQLAQACTEGGYSLLSVSAEEAVWGQWIHPQQSQLLLHRRGLDNLQLSAFKQQTLCFQRQLRGFGVPLLPAGGESDMKAALQLDSLALELQRSLDFLSAQLRDAPITQVVISCDEDDDQQLAQALSARLSVNVEAVAPPHAALAHNAVRIAYAAAMDQAPHGINFYSDALKPKVERMTLTNVVLSWGVMALVLAAVMGWQGWQQHQVQTQRDSVQQELQQVLGEIQHTQRVLASRVPSPLKHQLAERLAQQLASKQSALAVISQHDDSLTVGYASLLQQLALADSQDIALQHIHATGTQLSLSGLARTPAAVPAWVQQFQPYPALASRRFQQMVLERDSEQRLIFSLQGSLNHVANNAVNNAGHIAAATAQGGTQ